MRTFLFFIICINAINSLAQEPFICAYKCETTLSRVISTCRLSNRTAIISPIPVSEINPYIEFNNIVKSLLDENNKPYKVIYNFKECSTICNAAAVMVDSIQFILYNRTFVNSIRLGSEMNKWAVRAIIAHEIAHHLLGHSTASRDDMHSDVRQKQELQADFISAFIIKRFPGGTLENAIAGVRTFDPKYYSPKNEEEAKGHNYPTIAKRLEAIKEAFESDNNSPMNLSMIKKIDSIGYANYTRFGRSAIYREINELMSANNLQKVIEKIDDLSLLNQRFDLADVLKDTKNKTIKLEQLKIAERQMKMEKRRQL